MKRLLTLVAFFATVHASAQQVNPVPDYVFANRMSAGRNTVTDTAAYFSIGPRYGATRGMMPPMVVDTASFSANKRNGLLIFSVQKNKFLYWDSVGVKWAEMAGTGGSAITGSGVAGYMPEFTTTTNLDTTRLYHSAGRFAIGNTTTSNGVFNVYGGQSYFDTSLKVGSTTFLADESKNEVYVNTLADSGSYALQVNGSIFGNANARIHSSTPIFSLLDTDTRAEHRIQGDNNSLILYSDITNTASSSQIKFSIDGTESMWLTSVGNLGIGEPSPTYTLESAVSNAGGIASPLQLKNYAFASASPGQGVQIAFANERGATASNGYVSGLIRTQITNIGNGASAMSFHNWSGSAIEERMRLTSAGNLGIRTNAPTVGLVVNSSTQILGNDVPTSGSGLELYSSGTKAGTIAYNRTGSAYIPHTFDASQHEFLLSGVERMRLSTNTELLINTTTDAGDYKLQVVGNVYTTGSLTTGAPSGGSIKPWKIGEAATVSPTSPNRTIRVEIDGTVYYLHAKTTND